MANVLAHFMRRITLTSLVLVALFVACMPAQATPCDMPLEHAVHATVPMDDVAAGEDVDPAPSIEDNTVNLDDTFDVPRDHALFVTRGDATRPPTLTPPSHAHHHSFELRPPIA